jgi:hypothetical protein
MFEFSILCVIAIAIGYCATLWVMGRRDDVIYGQFIQTEQFPAVNLEPPPATMRLDVETIKLETPPTDRCVRGAVWWFAGTAAPSLSASMIAAPSYGVE